GNGHVVVPKVTWKVILVLDGGGTRGPLARVNAKSRLIAVSMPNTREPNENVPWTKYVVTAAEIEKMTGLTFFEKVPAEIMGPLKKKVDQAMVERGASCQLALESGAFEEEIAENKQAGSSLHV